MKYALIALTAVMLSSCGYVSVPAGFSIKGPYTGNKYTVVDVDGKKAIVIEPAK